MTWPGRSSLADGRGPSLAAVPFLRRFCQATELAGKALDIRLEQRIGCRRTPPSSFRRDVGRAAGIFRPCPAPEINGRGCLVNLTTARRTAAPPAPGRLHARVTRRATARGPGTT